MIYHEKNYSYLIVVYEIIELRVKKMSSDSFKNVINVMKTEQEIRSSNLLFN